MPDPTTPSSPTTMTGRETDRHARFDALEREALDAYAPDVHPLIHGLIQRARAIPVGSLDEAWAAAEAALPEGEYLTGVQLVNIGPDGIETWQAFCSMEAGTYESGPTAVAALAALAVKLREEG